jgi:hypothetical protein
MPIIELRDRHLRSLYLVRELMQNFHEMLVGTEQICPH